MHDYYQILGLNSSATSDEIRRAYRILARRYHPDVNPGRSSEEKFKLISEAYQVLSDTDKRTKFDYELETREHMRLHARLRGYQEAARAQQFKESEQKTSKARRPESKLSSPPRKSPPDANLLKDFTHILQKARLKAQKTWNTIKESLTAPSNGEKSNTLHPQKLSFVEVSLNLRDALLGGRRTIEINEPEGLRKISIRVPPGVRSGSVLNLRQKGKEREEELVVVFRIAQHPLVSIQQKGVVIEVPITLQEAICGASITVPTFEDASLIKISPGTQNGTEIRLKEKGISHKDGTRGDLFIRLMVKVPTCWEAVGIKDKISELEAYYEHGVREDFPKTILEVLS